MFILHFNAKWLSVQVKSSGSSPTLQSRTVTPSSSTRYITADSGYDGLSQVTVYGDSNLVSSNIKSGVSIFGVSGNLEVGEYKVHFWEKTEGFASNGYMWLGRGTSTNPYKLEFYSSFAVSGSSESGKRYQIRAFCLCVKADGIDASFIYNSQALSDNIGIITWAERISGQSYFVSDIGFNDINFSSDKSYLTWNMVNYQDYLNSPTVTEIYGYYLYN